MNDFEQLLGSTLLEGYLSLETQRFSPLNQSSPLFEKYIQGSQPQTQEQRINYNPQRLVKNQPKHQQSNLHNCPKHLIKLIIQCLGLGNQASVQIVKTLKLSDPEIQENIRNLLGILEMVRRNKLKSYSKQLLKIVFENNSQNISRLRLLKNPLISKVFQEGVSNKLSLAKDVLREFAIEKLVTRKDNYSDRSRNQKKNINDRYLSLFLQELRVGRIKERISKIDKTRIFLK